MNNEENGKSDEPWVRMVMHNGSVFVGKRIDLQEFGAHPESFTATIEMDPWVEEIRIMGPQGVGAVYLAQPVAGTLRLSGEHVIAIHKWPQGRIHVTRAVDQVRPPSRIVT